MNIMVNDQLSIMNDSSVSKVTLWKVQTSEKLSVEKKKRFRSFLTFILFLSTFSFSQVTTEQFYHGARSMAIAGSNVAHQDDAFASFANPAALAQLKTHSIVFAFEKMSGQSYLPHASFAGAFNLGKKGIFSLSAENLSVTVGSAQLTQETAIGAHYGFFLQKDRNSSLSIGIGAKYLSVSYGQSAGASGDGSDGIDLGKSQTFGLDLGLQASLQKRHWMGVFVKNINKPQLGKGTLVDLPRIVNIGLAYSIYDLVWTTFALHRAVGHPTQYSAGLEYELLPGFILLSGVHSNPNRLGAGFRLNQKNLNIDYGLLTHPIFSLTHQISIGLNF